jgi:hypothetical protein
MIYNLKIFVVFVIFLYESNVFSYQILIILVVWRQFANKVRRKFRVKLCIYL